MPKETLTLHKSNADMARALELTMELDSLKTAHQEQLAAMQQENDRLTGDLATAIEERKALQSELVEIKAERDDPNSDTKRTAQELRELKSRHQKLETELGEEKAKRKAMHSAQKELKAQLAKYDGPKLKSQLVNTREKVKQLSDDVKRQNTAYAQLKKESRAFQSTIAELKAKIEKYTADSGEDNQDELYNYVSDCERFAVISTHFKHDECQPHTEDGLNYRVLDRTTGASPIVRFEDGKIRYTELGDVPSDVEEYLKSSIGVAVAAEGQVNTEEEVE
jgi:chromosome segregation ATPase